MLTDTEKKLLLRYVQPNGDLPNVFDTKAGAELLIIGSAACVVDDLERYDKVHPGDRMALNDAIPFYLEKGPLTYATSLHVEKLDKWMNYGNGAETHSGQRTRTHPTYQWHIHRDGGTTGLFAVLIGLLMGYDKIVLAGCPTDASPRYFEDIPHPQFGLDTIKDEWLRARDAVFNGKVKSLSGRSREWLGEP